MTIPTHDLLQQYDRCKLDLSDTIRLALEDARNTGNSALLDELKAVLVRLASDQFNVAFVGQFSRGKSTVMNALLRKSLLPVGVVPLTSVITVVKYGSRTRVLLRFPNSRLAKEISTGQLAQYVTQTNNPGNVKGIEIAEIQTPVDLLLRGVCMVDTPGLGSSIEANTRTTEDFLPKTDALVVVTAVDSPVTEDEARLLRDATDRGKRVFVAVNKADLLNEDRLAKSAHFVREVVARISPAIQVYTVSAQQQVQGTNLHKNRLSECWSSFESDLRSFLAEQRAAPFLINNCDRVLAILRLWNGNADNVGLIGRAARIRSAIAEHAGMAVHEAASRSQSFSTQSCFICNGAVMRVHEFLAKYQYEITKNTVAREHHASVNGFCDLHSWQYERVASPRGVCTAYPPLLQRLADALRNDVPDVAHDSCPACQMQARAERELVGEIPKLMQDGRHPVVCVPHLKLTAVVGVTHQGELSRTLSELLVHMSETMQRFAMKQEALRRDLQSEEEQYVHRRGLALLVGHPQLKSGR